MCSSDLLAITRLANSKQDVLTFDSAPTMGSSNPVTSGGVYSALANLGGYKVVPSLSSVTEPDDKTIYLVKDSQAVGDDKYEEYIWQIDEGAGSWQKIGDTSLDLSPYVQNTDYATASTPGIVKPDGSTITIDNDGTLHGNSVVDAVANGNMHAVTSNAVFGAMQFNFPTGGILPFAGETAPNGYLLCDGTAYSRTEYASLFSVIGVAYGIGDGVNTFNVPDLREAVPVGAHTNTTHSIATHDEYSVGEFKDDQLQSHKHYRYANDTNGCAYSAAGRGVEFWTMSYNDGEYGESTGHICNGRTGTTTHGKQLGVNYIIKY